MIAGLSTPQRLSTRVQQSVFVIAAGSQQRCCGVRGSMAAWRVRIGLDIDNVFSPVEDTQRTERRDREMYGANKESCWDEDADGKSRLDAVSADLSLVSVARRDTGWRLRSRLCLETSMSSTHSGYVFTIPFTCAIQKSLSPASS